MSSRADLNDDFEKLRSDATQLSDESTRLRGLNIQMLAALRDVLPILQEGLPATVDYDWTKQVIEKVQGAIAEAERDS